MGFVGSQRSQGVGSDKRYHIITRILSTSFSTGEFQWFHEEGWEEEHLQELMAQHLPMPLGLYHQPSWVKARNLTKSVPDRLLARWILRTKQPDGYRNIGYGEAYAQIKGFTQVKLFVSLWNTENLSTASWQQALSLLISGILIGTKGDILKVYPLSLPAALSLQALFSILGDKNESGTLVKSIMSPVNIWSFLAGYAAKKSCRGETSLAAEKALIEIKALEVAPSEWWASISGKKSAQTLHYLTARMTSVEDRNRLRRRRPGKFSRFLRW
jgi:hypothetical protein